MQRKCESQKRRRTPCQWKSESHQPPKPENKINNSRLTLTISPKFVMTWGFQISNPKPLKTRITPYLMMLPAWFHCISSILVVQNAHLWISPTLLCLALLLHRKVIAESKKSHRGCKYTCPINFVDANNFQLHEHWGVCWKMGQVKWLNTRRE